MIFEWIFSIPVIFNDLGVETAVISPGSRSAPLTLAFARHAKIRKYIIPDERSAGYIALGIALSTGKPVILICTSGTAAVNLYPAITEAFYQKIPLIILSADRPPEWIDQGDGQTIRQKNLFKNHIKKSINMPVPDEKGYELWHNGNIFAEAFQFATTRPMGPVHINLPFREPLYPERIHKINELTRYKLPTKPAHKIKPGYWDGLIQELKQYRKIIIVAGQYRKDLEFFNQIKKFAEKNHIPVLAEVIANLGDFNHKITTHDLFLSDSQKTDYLSPDLILSFGDAVLSKYMKIFLRKQEATHWHITEDGQAADVFKKLKKVISVSPILFLQELIPRCSDTNEDQIRYCQEWLHVEKRTRQIIKSTMKIAGLNEPGIVVELLKTAPGGSTLHLANSMPVRWANCFQSSGGNHEYFSNRGTSGIDGCISTAVGIALNRDNINLIITGDMAFFYDRNGFWHKYVPENVRIVLLNNHGGGIFRIIEGPDERVEVEEYFIAYQPLRAENTAKDFNMDYYFISDLKSLHKLIPEFYALDGKPKILEIETDSEINKLIFEELNAKIKKQWN